MRRVWCYKKSFLTKLINSCKSAAPQTTWRLKQLAESAVPLRRTKHNACQFFSLKSQFFGANFKRPPGRKRTPGFHTIDRGPVTDFRRTMGNSETSTATDSLFKTINDRVLWMRRETKIFWSFWVGGGTQVVRLLACIVTFTCWMVASRTTLNCVVPFISVRHPHCEVNCLPFSILNITFVCPIGLYSTLFITIHRQSCVSW